MKFYQQFFLINPYPYKLNDDNRVVEDSQFLQKFFNKSQQDILSASNSYSNNPDGLRNFLFITRTYERLRKIELSPRATSLAVAIIIFTIEGIMGLHNEKKKKKPKNIDKPELRLQRYLIKFISRTDKLILLNSFAFSSRVNKRIPIKKSTDRHVMYRGMLKECIDDEFESFHTDWCSVEESTESTHCNCSRWLSKKDDKVINRYIKRLSSHLYKMRCSIVHDGIAPLISHVEEKPPNVTVWGMTLSDVYFDNKKLRYYRYNSALSRDKFEKIFISSLWKAFQAGYPRKIF